MAKTGTFGGFYFDPDVFAEYMAEMPFIKNAILASGVIREDPTIATLIGGKNNVGTMPFYKPIDALVDAPLNNDGNTNNTPSEIAGGKQTFMAVGRMKAFKDQDFTTELTGAKPLQHVANSINGYYAQVWQNVLMKEMDAVLGVSELATHVSDISAQEAVSEKNKIAAETGIDVVTKACGDMADRFTLVIMHSAVYATLQKLQLIEYVKYTDPRGLVPDVNIPTWNGRFVVVDDRGTVDKSQTLPVYKTYFAGKGAFLSAPKTLLNPYEVDRDPETKAGINKLYTKQTRVIHPNGFDIAVGSIATDSPTDVELANKSNWTLKFNEKNVPLAMIKSNG